MTTGHDRLIAGNMVAMANTKGGGRILVGIAEIAEQNDVTGPAVQNWRHRYEDFPEPIVVLRMGPVFDADEINEWITKQWDT